ncbi:hypothetical protein ACFLYR_00395 [Chloroflexota bacterium]
MVCEEGNGREIMLACTSPLKLEDAIEHHKMRLILNKPLNSHIEGFRIRRFISWDIILNWALLSPLR